MATRALPRPGSGQAFVSVSWAGWAEGPSARTGPRWPSFFGNNDQFQPRFIGLFKNQKIPSKLKVGFGQARRIF